MHPIVFELWDSFCQNTEDLSNEGGSNEMDTMMAFADDDALLSGASSPESEVDREQEALLLAAHVRSEKRSKSLKDMVSLAYIMFQIEDSLTADLLKLSQSLSNNLD